MHTSAKTPRDRQRYDRTVSESL